MIQEPTAKKTMRSAVLKIGVEKVRTVVDKLHIERYGVPIISNRRDSRYGNDQMDLGGGWLLMTWTDTVHKAEFLKQVSDALGLNLVIETFRKDAE